MYWHFFSWPLTLSFFVARVRTIPCITTWGLWMLLSLLATYYEYGYNFRHVFSFLMQKNYGHSTICLASTKKAIFSSNFISLELCTLGNLGNIYGFGVPKKRKKKDKSCSYVGTIVGEGRPSLHSGLVGRFEKKTSRNKGRRRFKICIFQVYVTACAKILSIERKPFLDLFFFCLGTTMITLL